MNPKQKAIDIALNAQRDEILNWAEDWFDTKRKNNDMWRMNQDELSGMFLDDLKSFLSQSSSNSDRDIATAKTSYARINQTSTSGRSIEKEDDNSNSDHDTLCGKKGIHTCKYPSFRPRGKK